MSEDDFDIGNDYEETDFEMDEEAEAEPSKVKVAPVKPKRAGRRRLEEILEVQRLRKDLLEDFDELMPENGTVYEDDIFTELYE